MFIINKMNNKYKFVKTTIDDKWNQYIKNSDDENIFFYKEYIENIGGRVGVYDCFNSSELRAKIIIPESEDGNISINNDLMIHSGIIYGKKTYNQGLSQVNSEKLDILTFVANELSNRYGKINFNLNPTITDIRPFQWFNYNSDNINDKYHINIKYTSYINISDFNDVSNYQQTELYKNASTARKQQIRYSKRDKVITEEIDKVSLFIDLYNKTFKRQGIILENKYLEIIENLINNLIYNNLAKLYVSKTKDSTPGSISVFAFDCKKAYYLFGASDPELRNTTTGTAVLWDSFSELAKLGIKIIDLEGVNSPQRGWFKMSFGGVLVNYYNIYK